ncbi:uncharacterized protein [Venturia canescens]|uniref:uncharacterized protein isoform X2 n=1 Tax=Venturia canescens TaxID=32260 RepID=UPI001C9D0A63|nr:uncharacterized protein LOC122407446 isoform X2 [Venturia canescens]
MEYWLIVLVSALCLTAEEIEAERSGWSATPNTQYHIQTDEGPERYFRFQTLNGQYRKEKRLEDGTVIGTEGWLDPLGYLRIKDYIADREGFRILKSKMVYVGKDRPIDDAVAVSKNVPAQSGILAKPRRPPNPFRQPGIQDVSSNSLESNTIKPYRLYSPVTRRYRIGTTTSSPRTNYYSSTIDPRPILLEDSYAKPATNYLQPSYDFQAPYEAPYRKSFAYVTEPSVEIEAPIYESNRDLRTSQSLDVQISPESSYGLYRHDRRSAPKNDPAREPIAANSTGSRPYRGATNYFTANRRGNQAFSNPRLTRNQQIHSQQNPPISRANKRSDLLQPPVLPAQTPEYEFPAYDGHHTNADGFQYYLKTHYHEEEKKPDDDKSIGSFGYVDPFGIRRVVYYKADSQNGFVHKHNNRYVGHNGTPYDPLPLNPQ